MTITEDRVRSKYCLSGKCNVLWHLDVWRYTYIVYTYMQTEKYEWEWGEYGNKLLFTMHHHFACTVTQGIVICSWNCNWIVFSGSGTINFLETRLVLCRPSFTQPRQWLGNNFASPERPRNSSTCICRLKGQPLCQEVCLGHLLLAASACEWH